MGALFSLNLLKVFECVYFKTNMLPMHHPIKRHLMKTQEEFILLLPNPCPRFCFSSIHASCKEQGCGEYTQAPRE